MTSIRGGAGKSSMATLVADIIRQHRQDRVLAIDADPGLGSLPLRLGAAPPRSLRELATARPSSWDEASSYLARTPRGLWLLSCNSGGQVGSELDYPAFQSATGGLSRYFSVSVIDCGAGLITGLHRGILSSAHAQIFVAPATADGALSTRAALRWFAENGFVSLLSRTTVVLATQTPNPDTDLERARHLLAAGGRSVEVMPYDRHLAPGITISADRISATTRAVATRVAAQAFVSSTS
ncbi:hypothetical protein ACGFNU_17790 [Spirillospora sp. NPDC048911]|uniref:nucleotide-binding protein n=1 Tax=Spirillospora sp. NPDC048911 TaxID=3364527 RepID=UPI0037225581